jgi:SAM-dependent methyltransferase
MKRRIGRVARPVLGSLGVSRFRPIWAPPLTARHVQNCRLFATRDEMLSIAPKGAACAEVGVETGYFSARILERTRPSVLHLVDRNLSLIQYDTFPIRSALDMGVVRLHQGDSSEVLRTFEDGLLDWIYIDGDHSYEGVQKDIAQAVRVVKPDGLLIFNDYTQYSALEQLPYGVMKAVNELCLERQYELVGLALQGLGYFDVAIRKMVESG